MVCSVSKPAPAVVWGCRVGAGSPFTVTAPDQALSCCCVGERGCGWVEHILLLVRIASAAVVVGAGFGTLLGPEETPARVCSWWTIPGLACLTRGVPVFGVFCVVVGVGFGVWLCVECCIVDASILLWSSV